MRFITARGIAALCLLAVLPRLGATVLTVTQAISYNASSYRIGGNIAVYSALWQYQQFDDSLGELESVTLTVTASARVSAFDVNVVGPAITPVPITVTPYVSLSLTGTLSDLFTVPSDFVRSEGVEVYVPPYGSFSHSADLSVGFTKTTSNVSDLARFSGRSLALYGLPPHVALLRIEGSGYGHYGSNDLQGVINATLVYNYRVSEHGQTVVLFGGALGLVGLVIRARGRRAKSI